MSDFIQDFVGTVPGAFVSNSKNPPQCETRADGERANAATNRPLERPGNSSGEGNAKQEEHRAFDIAMAKLSDADRAGMAVQSLIEARQSLLTACVLLRTLSQDQGIAALVAVGFDIFTEKRAPCDCGVPCCFKVRHTIEARCLLPGEGNGRSVVIRFDVKEAEVQP